MTEKWIKYKWVRLKSDPKSHPENWRKTYWEHSKKKASRKLWRARSSNWILLFFQGRMSWIRKQRGIYESPSDRYVPISSPAKKKSLKSDFFGSKSQRAPNSPEFAQPRLSRAKWHRSNTPRFVAKCQPHRNKHTHICTLSLGMTTVWPTHCKRGCANSGGLRARWKSRFGVTLGETPKVTFESLLIFQGLGGSRGFLGKQG